MEELLKLDKLPTVNGLQFLLFDVLNEGYAVDRLLLSSTCKEHSFDLAMSFDNAIKLLDHLSLIITKEEKSIKRANTLKKNELSSSDHSFSTFITIEIIKALQTSGLFTKVFNNKTLQYDERYNTFIAHTSLIPFQYPLINVYLLAMGIARPAPNVVCQIIINDPYREMFYDHIYSKIELSEEIECKIKEIKKDKKRGLSLFISYSHKDELLKDELKNHLSGLITNGTIIEWHDRMILPGDDWDKSIKLKLEQADLIIFMISSYFMASKYINDVEVTIALERHSRSLARIIPIIAKPCDLSSLPFSHLQAIPTGAKAITLWSNRHKAYLDIVMHIKEIIEK